MQNDQGGFSANGFLDREGEPNSRFVSVTADFPLRDKLTGAHVGAVFYMHPVEARKLAHRILRAADIADGVIATSEQLSSPTDGCASQ